MKPKKSSSKTKKQLPYTQWEHKHIQIEERLNNLPIHRQAVENINHEEQKMRAPTKTRPGKESQPLHNDTIFSTNPTDYQNNFYTISNPYLE